MKDANAVNEIKNPKKAHDTATLRCANYCPQFQACRTVSKRAGQKTKFASVSVYGDLTPGRK